MKKIVIATIFFFIGLIIFMPKENLFFTLKKILKKEHIELVSKDVSDRFVDLRLEDTLFIYDGIESLKAKTITLSPWLFYNTIEAKDISASKALRDMLNIKVDELKITHTIFNPKLAKLKAWGKFGNLDGYIDLDKRLIHLILTPSASFKKSQIVRDYFRNSKEGLLYESNF